MSRASIGARTVCLARIAPVTDIYKGATEAFRPRLEAKHTYRHLLPTYPPLTTLYIPFLLHLTMLFAPLISLASAALAVASPIVVHPLQPRTGGPVINKPAANAVIQPGETFDFLYYSMADYGRSAYNTSIWLFSSAPGDLQANTKADTLTTGHFFGRFSTGNYPGE